MAQVIALTVGHEYVIERKDYSGTGYSWIVAKSDQLSVKEAQIGACSKPGCGIKQIWRISSNTPGVYLFSIFHEQPWTVKPEQHPEVESFLFKVVSPVTQAASKSESAMQTITIYLHKNRVVAYRKDGTLFAFKETFSYDTPVRFESQSIWKGVLGIYSGDGNYYCKYKSVMYDQYGTKVDCNEINYSYLGSINL